MQLWTHEGVQFTISRILCAWLTFQQGTWAQRQWGMATVCSLLLRPKTRQSQNFTIYVRQWRHFMFNDGDCSCIARDGFDEGTLSSQGWSTNVPTQSWFFFYVGWDPWKCFLVGGITYSRLMPKENIRKTHRQLTRDYCKTIGRVTEWLDGISKGKTNGIRHSWSQQC